MRLHSKTPPVCRSAFTLIELLIVISLIVVIAGIGFLTVPLFTSQQRASSNASIIVAWLGDAKVQALKDQRSTGVRFVLDPNNPNFVREMYYVQTPDDFTGGMGNPAAGLYLNANPLPSNSLSFTTDVDFTGGLTNAADWPVQPGDFLEINGGGLLYQITSVNPSANPLTNTLTVSRQAVVGQATSVWRVIRQPRRVPGEDSLTLNGNAVIDLNVGVSKNVPLRTVPIPGSNPPAFQPYYEILFAPNGGVVGRGTNTSNAIILWVRDSTQALPTDNEPVLISIQVRTGFIGTYQVDLTPGGDPYSFTRDSRASGM
jgi:prepilin-type N-terminal cleavage/methylation domain-containing protein